MAHIAKKDIDSSAEMSQKIVDKKENNSVLVPVIGLTLFAIAAGYLMSLIPLSLENFHIDEQSASWMASAYYLGLLIGSLMIEPVIAKIGHRQSFMLFILLLAATVALLPFIPNQFIWLVLRFIGGLAVAGIFVVIESWLLIGDNPKVRAKRLSFYMTSLYGGTTLGQLSISFIGTDGILPFMAVLVILLLAILPLLLSPNAKPQGHEKPQAMSLKQFAHLSKSAVIGCLTSGIVMGTIYGLLPLTLRDSVSEADNVGVMMSAVIVGGMLIQPIISTLSTRINKKLLLAIFSLLGVFAMQLTHLSDNYFVMITALALLGMSSFALYPIAISLACDNLSSQYIVSATQVMLFSYSIGSVIGPIGATAFMAKESGLMSYFLIVLLTTATYMLLATLRRKAPVLAN